MRVNQHYLVAFDGPSGGPSVAVLVIASSHRDAVREVRGDFPHKKEYRVYALAESGPRVFDSKLNAKGGPYAGPTN